MSDETMTMNESEPAPVPRTAALAAAATATGIRFLDGEVQLGGRDVTAIAAGPHGPVALVEGDEVHMRTPGGTWHAVARLEDGVGRSIVVHGGDVYVGGSEARLWRLRSGRLQRVASFDRAPTHERWHTPWGGPPDIYSFATHGSDLYVGVHVGGILRTSDGDTWVATIDLHDDVHQVATDGDGGLWAATGMRALAHSADRGETWEYLRRGPHAGYALAVAVGSAGPLVGLSSGPHARDGRIHRLVGDRLVRVDGLPDDLDGAVGPGRLVASGDRAVVALPSGDVYASDDAGATWFLALAGLGEVRALAFLDRA